MAETHVVHVFATYDAGGPQTRTADLIGRLPDGYVHSILAMDRRYGCRERTPEARMRRWLHLDELPPGRFLPTRLARYVLAQEPDVVATYNWGSIESVFGLARLGFRAIVHHEEGFGPTELKRQKLRRVLARRFVLTKAHSVVVPSQRLETIARDIWKIGADKLRFIPNGIDLTRFEQDPQGERRAAAKARFGIPAERLVIGSVGHLRPEKNYPRLLEAFAAVGKQRDVHLLLIGDGVDRGPIEARVRELALTDRVTMPGVLDDPRDAYTAFDVFVLSSNTEQMPVSLLEAMSVGRAVAATRVGDIAHMVAPLNADFIVDAAHLSDAIARLVDEAGLRQRLQQANRERCEQEYPIEVCLRRYIETYEAARAAK